MSKRVTRSSGKPAPKSEAKEVREPAAKKAKTSVYKVIDGKKYDRGMLEAAEAAVAGKHDYQISVEEAKTIIKEALDGNQYTDIEKETMHYIRENFKWTEAADEYCRHAVASWAATKAAKKSKKPAKAKATSTYKVIKGKKYDRGMLEAAEAAVAGKHDYQISVEEAKVIIKEAIDGNQYTDIEKETMHYIRENFKWTDAADEYCRHAIASWAATKAAKAK
eukprot:gb/GEZN01017949.1/.p1 GENE.gb/GEZN01017949.1/~~gb/GEZN01017949.1/.p1  ORF type:complete len:221 (+),score=54.98 gb/GEZN01017949.1/:28-690(+)